MQIKSEQLSSSLSRGLQTIYLVSGDDTLLVEEACDEIIAAASAQGFTERSIHHVEPGFHWYDITNDAASMSLFAERKILDLRLGSGKFDKEASEVLRSWCDGETSNSDTLLLLRTDRLQPKQRSSAWFKAIEQAGGIVLIWPMSPRDMPRWLEARLTKRGLSMDRDGLSYLADRVEGNLLAAAQEIEKLALQGLPQPISQQTLIASLEDTSRFTSFDMIDAAMAGDAIRARKVLRSLRQEGVSLFAILGALTSQLRRLGQSRGLPPARARILEQFAQRVRSPLTLLAECALIDQQGKGQRFGDAWVSLEQLVLVMAGTAGMVPPSVYQRRLRGR